MTDKRRTYTLKKRAQSATDTGARIVEAARALIEDAGYTNVSLDEIAAKAGVSRQTIYVQFGSKVGVLTAMVDHIQIEGLAPIREAMSNGTDPVEVLHAVVRLDYELNRQNYKIFRIFQSQAINDGDFRTVFQQQMGFRFSSIRRLTDWLHKDGKLADGWSVDEAAEWLFAITGFDTYDELVAQRGWTIEHLNRRILQTIDATLLK